MTKIPHTRDRTKNVARIIRAIESLFVRLFHFTTRSSTGGCGGVATEDICAVSPFTKMLRIVPLWLKNNSNFTSKTRTPSSPTRKQRGFTFGVSEIFPSRQL